MKFSIVMTLALFCASVTHAVTIDMVPVGNAGNANDPATGNLYGGVNYAYSIGKYEVTVGQYTAFLNAVAATDTYHLYSTEMATDLTSAGIARSGTPGDLSYSIIGSPNHPVTCVSWGDAARFVNWLQNGQPTGGQDTTTTEDGAYSLNGATSLTALIAVTRNSGATWFIPSLNEWYKAAYFEPAAQGGDADNYWTYPMKTNNVPYSDQPPGATPDNTRVCNFYQNDHVANGYDEGYAVTGSANLNVRQNYLTDVGAYTSSPSYYGTFDQGGNVWEWNETVASDSSREVRGGAWDETLLGPIASNRDSSLPTVEIGNIGFRVASIVPEPSTLALALGIFAPLAAYFRRG